MRPASAGRAPGSWRLPSSRVIALARFRHARHGTVSLRLVGSRRVAIDALVVTPEGR